MQQPNPWILLMGGGALFNLALMISSAKAPAWIRHAGMAVCVVLGVISIGLALYRYFERKPVRERYQPKRRTEVTLLPETAARLDPKGQRGSAGEPPPPPPDAA